MRMVIPHIACRRRFRSLLLGYK